MIASGWQTAPPQAIDSEVVLVTKSACSLRPEAPPRVPGLRSTAMPSISRVLMAKELSPHLAPDIIHAASQPALQFRILSATVSTT